MGGLARSPPTIIRAKPTHEEETMNNPVGGTAGPGQVISLTQRSAWRREYEMWAGGGALGWLRWRPGRRSFAQGEGRGIGIMELATRRRRLVVARAGSGGGGSVIHVAGVTPSAGRRRRANHRAMGDQDGTMLVIAAAQGALRASQQHRWAPASGVGVDEGGGQP